MIKPINPKFEENFSKFPNIFLDTPGLMLSMKKTEILCLILIVRKTFGWHKDRDQISNSQFVEFAGVENSVRPALKSLESKGIIIRTTGTTEWDINQWQINLSYTPPKNWETPQNDPLPKFEDTTPNFWEPPPSQKLGDTKEKQKKSTKEIKAEQVRLVSIANGWTNGKEDSDIFQEKFILWSKAKGQESKPDWTTYRGSSNELADLRWCRTMAKSDVLFRLDSLETLAKKNPYYAGLPPMPSTIKKNWNKLIAIEQPAATKKNYSEGNDLSWKNDFKQAN